MFDRDQPKIQAYALASANNIGRVLQFVILTIQTPLFRVAQNIVTAEQGGEDALAVLYGYKLEAYNSAWDDRADVLAQVHDLMHHALDDDTLADDLLAYVATLPGFDLAKAGFVVQLVAGVSGCIDSHNLARFGVATWTFTHFKRRKTYRVRRAMVARYNAVIRAQGGTRAVWDGWCHYVATETKFGVVYTGADHVSATHYIALGLA